MEARILGIRVKNRQNDAGGLQQILTDHGCCIRTRLGLHGMENDQCSSKGLIILELGGSTADMDTLEKKIKELKGLEVQKMVFTP